LNYIIRHVKTLTTNMVSTLNTGNYRVANVVLFHPQHCRWWLWHTRQNSSEKRHKLYKVLQWWNVKVH